MAIPHAGGLDAADTALLELLRLLDAERYAFVAPTPATHARVVRRRDAEARGLADVFGWSLPFAPGLLPPEIAGRLRAGGMVADCGGRERSLVRVSTLRGRLYLHSAFPTDDRDAVFFGPDSYRFADLIAAELRDGPPDGRETTRIADIGTGAGVGAIVAGLACPRARIVATDINPAALRLARINAAAAGVPIEAIETSGLDGVAPPLDVVTLNPPYIADEAQRAYRDGGAMHGGKLSIDLARAALPRLAQGGRLILYTGSAIVAGEDRLHRALAEAAEEGGCTLAYREIDPDVFGEELDGPAYADVDRIALVAAVMTRSG